MSTIAMRSFSGGEISPALYARVDTAKYQSGLRKLKNFFVLRHGGVATRPGTQFVGEVKDSTNKARLFPYKISNTENYVMVFGDLVTQYVQNAAFVPEVTSKTNLTIAYTGSSAPYTLGEVTFTSTHPLAIGDIVYGANIDGFTELNGRLLRVATVPTASSITLVEMDGSTAVQIHNPESVPPSGGVFYIVKETTSVLEEEYLFDAQYMQNSRFMVMSWPKIGQYPVVIRNLGTPSTWSEGTGVSQVYEYPNPNVGYTTLAAGVSGTAGSNAYEYAVTAVAADTFEESYIDATGSANLADPTLAAPHTITWTAISSSVYNPGIAYYNVYIDIGNQGSYAFLGSSVSTTFKNWGIDADYSVSPPTLLNPTVPTGFAVVGQFQQRLVLAAPEQSGYSSNPIYLPDAVLMSRTGVASNFTSSNPPKADDAFQFKLAGNDLNRVKAVVDIGKIIIFTEQSEWILLGDGQGVVSPTEIAPQQNSQYGCNGLRPIVSGDSVLFVQARGSIIRDLNYSFQDSGYNGNDLTIFSSHLFDDYTVVDWAYQKIPHSIVWVVRSDGAVLSLTYVREHQVWAWAQHDLGGIVESVTVIPEGSEDAIYFLVKRTINGRDRRYVERLSKRDQLDVQDNICMDCAGTYDGRSTNGAGMTMSGGTNYDEEETFNLYSSNYFTAADVGKEVHIYYDTDEVIRLSIEAFVDISNVTVRPNKTVPVDQRGVLTANWGLAVTQILGLEFLEGEEVSIFADGYVVASPNNSDYGTPLTVTNGAVTLPDHYAYVHVGLPITADFETLDIDTPQGETFADKRMDVTGVTLHLEKSRGLWVGPAIPEDSATDPLQNMVELKIRESEDYDDPVDLFTGKVETNIFGKWTATGRIGVRQVDPVPARILAAMPAGTFPGGK